jgi:hypothetical protein
MGLFVMVIGFFNNRLVDMLGLIGVGAVMAGLAYLWQRWVRSKLVESVTLWSDRLEIRRGGRDEVVAWADVESVTNAFGNLLVEVRRGRGLHLMRSLEGDTLDRLELALAKYRGRAGG